MKKKSDKGESTPPSDMRQRRTRRALREGLLELLKEKSLADITARDIAAQSLVGYNTFFRHYASSAELVDEIVQEETSQLLERTLPAMASNDTRKAALGMCEHVFERRALWAGLLNGGASLALRDAFVQRSLAEHRPTVRVAEHAWLPMELGAAVGAAATIEILSWWLKQPNAFTPQQVAEFIDRLVVSPTVRIGPSSKRTKRGG